MSHEGSYCQDLWNSGPNPDCHSIGDEGADMYLAKRGGLTWMKGIWSVPSHDLSAVYK